MSGIFGGGDDSGLQNQIAAQNKQQQALLAREKATQETQRKGLERQRIAALRGRFGEESTGDFNSDDTQAPGAATQTPQNLFQKLTGRLSDFMG